MALLPPLAASPPVPPYSTSLSAGASCLGTFSPGQAFLPQAAARTGAEIRYALPSGWHASGGLGLIGALPSPLSGLGMGYRGFSAAWAGAALGYDFLDGRLGADIGLDLYSGYLPGTYLAQGMAGAGLRFMVRDPVSRPWLGRAANFLGGKADSPPPRAELSFPLGIIFRNGAFSLEAGLALKLWTDPLSDEAKE